MKTVFNRPVPAEEIEYTAGGGLLGSQAGDALDDLMVVRRPIQVANGSFHFEDLPAVGEVHIVVQVSADPDLTGLQPAVALVDRFGLRGEKTGARGLQCVAAGWVGCP